jgi:hypothetical protein
MQLRASQFPHIRHTPLELADMWVPTKNRPTYRFAGLGPRRHLGVRANSGRFRARIRDARDKNSAK